MWNCTAIQHFAPCDCTLLRGYSKGDTIFSSRSQRVLTIFLSSHRMHELGISPQERKVFFGQLFGMSDAISFTLGMRVVQLHICISRYSCLKYWFTWLLQSHITSTGKECCGPMKHSRVQEAHIWKAQLNEVKYEV